MGERKSAKELLKRLEDFTLYAPFALKIRTKSNSLAPFVLNRVQLHIHDLLEQQKRETGKVRAMLLKGRQQGCSTYVEGRYYHITSRRFGWQTFILTHEDQATQNLFKMAKRYHEHCPQKIRPSTGASNAIELLFDKLDSGYKLGTAKTKGTGRSATIQCFHGSEVAFWQNAADHAAGIFQAIPDANGTESILESTANGMGNFFHAAWRDAEAGISDYMPIFIPWYWQQEYRRTPKAGFELTTEEETYLTLWGLDLAQMAWRRAKIVELKDPTLFKQEYPSHPAEAFQITGEETFIKAEKILQARRNRIESPIGAVVAGFDPDAGGTDGASMIFRKGQKAFGLSRYKNLDAMAQVGKCVTVLNKNHDPYVAMLFIDASADGIIARLREMGYSSRITAVFFGGRADDEQRYKNKRNEMWDRMDQWLNDVIPVEIPDDDTLHADLMSPRFTYDSNHNRVLESKQQIKNRGLRSPNDADALALTFAYPMAEHQPEPPEIYRGPRSWMM